MQRSIRPQPPRRPTRSAPTRRHLGARTLALLVLLPPIILVAGSLLASQARHGTSQPDTSSLGSGAQITGTPTPAATAAAVLTTPPENPQSGTALPLSGRRIGLDAGHGPRDDLGAVLVDPDTDRLVLSEAEFTLDVALRCRDILRARGADVVLTRETADTFTAHWPADANGDGTVGDLGDDLQERIDILNGFGAEVFLSIHANSSPDSSDPHDVQVIYCGTADCPFPAPSEHLAAIVLSQLKDKLAVAGYVPHSSEALTDLSPELTDPPEHMFLLGPANRPRHVRATDMPGVLAESLYVSSPEQAAQLNRPAVRQAIALAYADALQSYLTGDGAK